VIRLAGIAIRKPKSAIAVWLALVAGLGFAGSQIQSRFSPSILVVKGTESSRAQELATSRFGNSVLVPIMLEGPTAQLDRQGPALVQALRLRPDARILSPWDKTPGSSALRPRPGVATIVTAVERSEKTVANTVQPQIDRTVKRYVSSPVTAYVTGQPTIDRAMRGQSIYTTRTAVLFGLPVLFLLLTVLFGAPVLAALVVGFAGSVLAVGYGLTALVAAGAEVDPVAVAGGALVGLSLGAAFALMLIARYREEMSARAADDPHTSRDDRVQASIAGVGSAGRTVLLAGTAIVLTMVVATLLATTEILNSVGIGATIMSAVAAVACVGVLPAVLVLVGHRLDALSFAGLWQWLAARLPNQVPRAIVRHPAVLGGLALASLLALAIPVLHLGSGPPDPKYLPSDNGARQAYEKVSKEMGAGWVTPFELIVAKQEGTITTRRFLAELQTYQTEIAADPAVKSVVGPGTILPSANQLQGVPRGLNTAANTAKSSKKDLKTLIAGLGQAGDGVTQLRQGLASAASGAAQLDSGSGQAGSGSAQLAAGIEQAGGGAGELTAGLDQASSGAGQLKTGAHDALGGSRQLSAGISQAEAAVTAGLPVVKQLAASIDTSASELTRLGGLAQGANADVQAALQQLDAMTTGKNDPSYGAVSSALQRAAGSSGQLAGGFGSVTGSASSSATTMNAVASQIVTLQAGLVTLKQGSADLAAGLTKLSVGNSGLASGLRQLDAGSHALSSGLGQLATGAQQLHTGLGQLHGGTGRLAGGLGSAVPQSAPLASGMSQITAAVIESRNGIPSTKDLEALGKQSPHLFDSGYFVLAALQGSPTAARQAAGFTVNVERGGAAGRITVVPKWGANDPRTRALDKRLQASAAAFAKRTGTQTAVGGNAASLGQYRSVAGSKLPAVVAGILLLSYLLLLVVTRSLVLPLVAVALNLVTTGATFGILTLLFGGSSPLLGGPGFMDPVTIIEIVTGALGMSLLYEIFVLSRARERYDAGYRADAGLYGLRKTWPIVTGLTLPMVAVGVLFAPSLLTMVRELAIGTLVAVLISATLVRLVLLPAAMVLLGRYNWWMPGWLGRRVPRVHFGEGRASRPRPGVLVRATPQKLKRSDG
jgi:putative drug exporter of the RND superfamily